MKKSLCCTVVGIGALFFYSSAILHASEQFNQIDAFTSTSPYESLKIIPSKVYKNYAVISWSEDFDDKNVNAYGIRWGTQPQVFTDSVNVKRPFIAEVIYTDTLTSLTENTAYYAEFYRDYNRKMDYTPFRFNTPPLPTIPPVSIKQVRLSALSTNIIKTIKSVEIYTASGKRFKRTIYNPGKTSASVLTAIKSPGLYLIFYKNSSNQIVSSEKILINR